MHTTRHKAALINRIRRIAGQVGAIERAVEADAERENALQLLAAVRGAMDSLLAEILEEHIRLHALTPGRGAADRQKSADDVAEVIRAYLK